MRYTLLGYLLATWYEIRALEYKWKYNSLYREEWMVWIFKPISHFKVMTVITTEMRYHLMKASIEYSDAYDENYDLFNQGIQILEERIKTQNFEEFTVDERETLEQITTIMETFNIPKSEK